MPNLLSHPWPWYIAGPIIGLMVPLLLLMGNKMFGISATLRHICAACFPGNIPFFKYDWKKETWNLFFAGGILLGGVLTALWMHNPEPVQINEATRGYLESQGLRDFTGLLPNDLFGTDAIFSLKGLIFLVVGGFLIGFGTRYAGGCTSGHSIMGLSNLQWPSLVATLAFMAGGFMMVNLLLPAILRRIL